MTYATISPICWLRGAQAYADSFHFDHPERDHHALAVEAVASVNDFHDAVIAEE
jgi:hypothetical protein